MAGLVCDICGGKLMSDGEGEIFTCASCGTLYPKERVKKMFVELSGPVQVEGIANTENLYKRANQLLEDGDWQKAGQAFERVLDIDAEYAPAHMGKLFIGLGMKGADDLHSWIVPFDQYPDTYPEFQKAWRYADPAYRVTLEDIIAKVQQNREAQYQKAMQCMESGKNTEAEALLEPLWGMDYKDSVKAMQTIKGRYSSRMAEARAKIKPYAHVICAENINYQRGIVVALHKDGSCGNLRDLVAVSFANDTLIGLKANGTVLRQGEGPVSGWRDIAVLKKIYGIKRDGTVLTLAAPPEKTAIESWTDIVDIAGGRGYTVGLKSDGTCVSVGQTSGVMHRHNVKDWRDIVAIDVYYHTVGLKSDGTVLAIGDGPLGRFGECNVSSWRDIVAVAAGAEHTLGLKADGTVVAAGNRAFGRCNVEEWRDIVAISANKCSSVGLKSDGTCVSVGDMIDAYGQAVSDLRDIGPPSPELAQKRAHEDSQKAQQERARAQRAQGEQWAASGLCRYCGGKLGMFGKKCKSCGEAN